MVAPLKILLVEDSADDAALLERELRRAGLGAEVHRVETPEQFRQALHSFDPSLIISDYSLPQFSAPAALRAMQESGLDLPFIVVSGTVGEDAAVEVMKAGAHDYVMKMNLTRLSAAIRRELHEAFIRDERNRAEVALRRAQSYLERAQEIAHLGSWVHSLDGSEPMIWSAETHRIFRLGRDEFDGSPETLFGFTHPEEQKRVFQARQLAIEGEAPYAVDHRIILRDGSIRWVHEEAVVERDGSGKPLRMVGAVMDITARKQAEEELRRSETLMARLAESGVIGILVSDVFGRIQDANEPLLRMLGYSRSELLEKLSLSELTPPEWWHVDDLALQQLKTKGSVHPWEKEYRRKDGSRVPVLVGMAMLDSAQRISFVLDISERKRLEEEQKKIFQLEEQTRRAQEASQFKSKFLANMSHELRTPLNAVIGFSELLEQETLGPLTSRQKEYVQNILTSGQHLLSLVNDVLDISKVEAGRMELAREWTSLARVVESVERILQSLAEKKRVTLELSVSDLPDVFIDPVRMKQILYNLLANGIKFTPAGGVVRLGVRIDEGHLQLSVDDTGIGMQPDQLSRLFKPFEQLHERGAADIEGTGLGLALTKSLVELHGGMITVRSEVGRGSSFKVMLPMRSAILEGLPEQVRDLSEELILVVGNDTRATELLARHIRALGLSVAQAASADSGLQIACELRPLAVILDLQTPRIDESWAMVARVKSHPAISNVPVIVFSVIPEPNRALYLGAMDYLVKPQRREQLAECLARVGVKTYPLDGVRIVLVGQFNTDLAALALALKEAGCLVRAASKLDPQDFAKQPADLVIGGDLAAQRCAFDGGASPAALINLVDGQASASGGSGSPPLIDLSRADALRTEQLVRVVHRAVETRERGPSASNVSLLSHLRQVIAKAASQSKKFALVAVRLPPTRGSDGDWMAALRSHLRPDDFLALTREDVLVLVAAGVDSEDDALRVTLRLKDLLWSLGKLKPARVQLLWYPAHGTNAEELVRRCIEHSTLEARQ